MINDVIRIGLVMGVQVGWDDETNTILHYKMDGRWRWNELYNAVKEGHALNSDTSHDVYVIVNLEKSLGVPPSAMAQFGTLATLTRPNTRVVVFVAGGGFVSTLIKTFNRIYSGAGVQSCWVATLAEAYTLVHREQLHTTRKGA
jgi:hypothetical protein